MKLQTPLDMLAAVGMKNSKITPAGSSAPRGAAVQTKAPDKSAVRGCNAYASRSHLAKITTQSDYFSTAHHLVDLDWLPDHDPIGLSLVTETEAREIIDYYFRHCNPLVSIRLLSRHRSQSESKQPPQESVARSRVSWIRSLVLYEYFLIDGGPCHWCQVGGTLALSCTGRLT